MALLVFTIGLHAQLTVVTNYAWATEYTTPSPTFLYGSNSVFTQYGLRTTNESGTIYTWGISLPAEMDKCPPEQFTFDFTGTNFEIVFNGFPGNGSGNYTDPYFSISDGVTNVSYTNSPRYTRNNSANLFSYIRFPNNTIHHITIRAKGGFVGINYTNGTFAATTPTVKPNLLIDESDSYGEGFNPTVSMSEGGSSFWFDGFLWQLMTNQPNLFVVPCALSGTGFYTTNAGTGGLPYWTRTTNDVCALYTNALGSGLYSHIFICANGTINDLGQPTNAVFQNATNVLGTFERLCPAATVFLVGNWLGAGGETSPGANDYALEWAMTNAAAAVGVPCFDPIPANLKNAGNYNTFYPTGSGTDSIHPSAAGYQIYANWLQTNLANTFSGLYTNPGVLVTDLYLTNYGCVPDATNFTGSTVSNSVTIGTPYTWNTNATIGKVLEVFRAGPWVGTTVTNQDIICTITNVSNGTNLLGTISAGWTGKFLCTVGTYDAPAFQAASLAASSLIAAGATNVNIHVPAGSSLVGSSNMLNPSYVMTTASDSQAAITNATGGVTWMGDGANQSSVILCFGAGMNHTVASGTSPLPMRCWLFLNQSPTAFSQLPLIYTNLVLDGGVTNGWQSYSYAIIQQGDGSGWDVTHDAIVETDPTVTGTNFQMMGLTNCTLQHWRGEMLKWIGTKATNAYWWAQSCTFYDGNASAFNYYGGHGVTNCLINLMAKGGEDYQQKETLPTWYVNDLFTNMNGNGNTFYSLSIVGATTNETEAPINIIGCTFPSMAGVNNMNDLQFSSAANVNVASNNFLGVNGAVIFTSAGTQPNDGTQIGTMTNFYIGYNTFDPLCVNPISMDGYSVTNVTILGNTNVQIHLNGGIKDGIFLGKNSGVLHDGQYDVDGTNVQAGGHFMVDSNDNTWVFPLLPSHAAPNGGQYAATNLISAGYGRFQLLQNATKVFVFDTNSQTLTGTQLTLTNETSSTISPFRDPGLSYSTNIAGHTAVTFTYTNSAWWVLPPPPSTNATVFLLF
jgi:hypothetical protein